MFTMKWIILKLERGHFQLFAEYNKIQILTAEKNDLGSQFLVTDWK